MKKLRPSIYRQLIHLAISCCLLITTILTPATATAFSIGEEREIGEELLGMVRKSFDLMDEPDINQYINKLGQEILTVTDARFFDYHFFVINDKEFNAFAAPSGLIFIHSGLIEAMEDEGELISVMAHECGHVTSRHIADRLKKTAKTSMASVAVLLAAIAVGSGELAEAMITGSMAASAQMNLKFSRADEEEADRLAYKWMRELGTDPTPMATMLMKMHRVNVYRAGNIPPYLLTHPEPRRRMGYVQDLLMMDDNSAMTRRDNFEFQRIKQRITAYAKNPVEQGPLFRRQTEKTDITPQQVAMGHYGLYLTSLAQANFQAATSEIKQVMEAFPNRAILTADLAIISFQQGRYQEALSLLQAAHAKEPDDAYSAFHLARTWQQLGQEGKALDLYKDLLETIPDYSRLHYEIGGIETRQNQPGLGHYHLALYFWYEGNTEMTRFHLKQAMKDPETEEAIKEIVKEMQDKIKKQKKR